MIPIPQHWTGILIKIVETLLPLFINLQGKVVAVKKAQAKQGKIYVGKLMPELSDEDIKTHFTQVTIFKWAFSNFLYQILIFEANHMDIG